MGRFYGFFRLSSVISGIFFSKFVFPYLESHPQIIYPGGAIFYLAAVFVLCFFVREGRYPAKEIPKKADPWYIRTADSLKSYGKECFSKSYYWWYYIAGLLFGLAGCVNIFINFFYREGCNLTMQQIGTIGVYVGIVSAVSCFAAGFVVDKIGAFKSVFIAQGAMAVIYIAMGIFMRDYVTSMVFRMVSAVFSSVNAVAGGRILVEVFARSKFGMLASGRNLLISLVVGFVNYPVGLFSDFLKKASPDTTLMVCGFDIMPMLRGYRFINYWAGLCYLLAVLVLIYFYLFHHRKRTDKAYEL